MKLLFLDVEGTGCNEHDHSIVEIGGIYMDAEKEKEFQIQIKPRPDRTFEAEALEIIGLSMNDLNSRGVSNSEAYVELTGILNGLVSKFDKNDKLTVFAYNQGFDNRWIRKLFEDNDDKYFGSYFFNPWIDVMSLAANKVIKERPLLKDFKLGTVCEYFGVPVDTTKAHGALYDAKLCMELYKKIT